MTIENKVKIKLMLITQYKINTIIETGIKNNIQLNKEKTSLNQFKKQPQKLFFAQPL
jgi:hypothetical protein